MAATLFSFFHFFIRIVLDNPPKKGYILSVPEKEPAT
jgi:hypothetical protein